MITPVCVCPPRMSKNGGALLHKLQPCVVCLPVVTNANSPESAFCMYIIRVPLWFGSVLEVKGKHDVSAWFLHVFLVSQLGLLLYTFHIGIEHSLTLRVLFCWSVLFFILFAWIFLCLEAIHSTRWHQSVLSQCQGPPSASFSQNPGWHSVRKATTMPNFQYHWLSAMPIP